jgi:hypothetical protein
MADLGPCAACGAPGSGIRLNDRPYCDPCADQRLANATGWPVLPAPPPAEVIIGPDHTRHFVRYRMLRMPGGVVALAEEIGGPLHAGYRLELLGDHFADPSPLLERLRTETRAAIAHPYLKVDNYHGLTIVGDVVAGRLEEAEEEDELDLPEDGPRLIVDGQGMSWAELGELLRSYVGWSFELRLGGDPPPRDERGDTLERITVRQPTPAEQRAAARALRSPDGAYILDSAHYPTPEEWAKRDQPEPIPGT